jgi:glycosyltransferase involved in cell wall biosynthesis
MIGAFLRGKSVWRARFDDPHVREAIMKRLGSGFDLVVCAGLPSAFCLPERCGNLPVWIDEQNVEWRILERAAKVRGGLYGVLARREADKLRIAEEGAVRRCAVVSTCSLEDARVIGSSNVLPNVSSGPGTDFVRDPIPRTLVFTGTLCWGPNVDAARWMAKEIMPKIRERVVDARLRIVGRDPGPQVKELEGLAGVEVVGEVPSIWAELARASVSVAPIRMGSGTRIKIIEAAFAGLPTVATTIGAEGLDFQPLRDIELADDASAFAQACIRFLENPRRAKEVGDNATRVAKLSYGPDGFRQQALALAEKAVSEFVRIS